LHWVDRKGRIGGIIHWLDLLLLLAVVMLMIRTIIVSWPRFDRKEQKDIRLEILVLGFSTDLAESIAIGQWVKDQASGEFMGKIIQKEAFPTQVKARGFGELNKPALFEKQDLILVLERSGRINEREGIFLGKETIRSGQERLFHTLYTEFPGKISRISVVGE
jgi:hypothetical protein